MQWSADLLSVTRRGELADSDTSGLSGRNSERETREHSRIEKAATSRTYIVTLRVPCTVQTGWVRPEAERVAGKQEQVALRHH
jgi:hypothetical protein